MSARSYARTVDTRLLTTCSYDRSPYDKSFISKRQQVSRVLHKNTERGADETIVNRLDRVQVVNRVCFQTLTRLRPTSAKSTARRSNWIVGLLKTRRELREQHGGSFELKLTNFDPSGKILGLFTRLRTSLTTLKLFANWKRTRLRDTERGIGKTEFFVCLGVQRFS